MIIKQKVELLRNKNKMILKLLRKYFIWNLKI